MERNRPQPRRPATTSVKAYDPHESGLAINIPLLEHALDLRHRTTSVLGYKIWADYVTEVKMVKTSGFAQTVNIFMDDLEVKLRPISIEKCEILLALKKDEQKECGFPSGGEFYIWDYTKESPLLLDTRTLIMTPYLHRYFDHMCVEKTLNLYDSPVKECFPVSPVVPTIFSIYQNLLGITFVEMTGKKKRRLASHNTQCGKETQMTTQVLSGTVASICFLAVCPDALYGNLRLT
ncbi:hypothetical protein PISMIDRAFT_19457 [Pisolithus microcarpus 441]|uniref:Peptidase M3A/M3B catalytic domain-containing protein n=1 Tax=Pisolithus microcarpus 441 TaxID=765257 RepID=A0A0C9YCD2_9AGAM|nr:hypothetical protein PISMIDRAFT_19457 [Pisolithus microcarpus 441]